MIQRRAFLLTGNNKTIFNNIFVDASLKRDEINVNINYSMYICDL